MKTADIVVGEEYRVAHRGKGTVLATGVPFGTGYKKTNSGVRLMLTDNWDKSVKERVVHCSEIKMLWADHEEILRLQREESDRLAAANQAIKARVAVLSDALGVELVLPTYRRMTDELVLVPISKLEEWMRGE